VHAGSAPLEFDQPGLAQNAQVVRDRRLSQIEHVDEIADARLSARGEAIDDRHPRRLRKGLETLSVLEEVVRPLWRRSWSAADLGQMLFHRQN